jgi:hypothetical protein
MDLRTRSLRLRQHHGIEHATVTVLSQRLPDTQLVARSDFGGFVVYGDVDADSLRAAAEDALARLQHGERRLAIHPNCGTNLATAGVLTGVAALVAGSGQRRSFWWERLPSAILAATLALFIAAPLGRWLQENITTSSDADGLRIASVEPATGSPTPAHRVVIEQVG